MGHKNIPNMMWNTATLTSSFYAEFLESNNCCELMFLV
jgi:hypothetical protein